MSEVISTQQSPPSNMRVFNTVVFVVGSAAFSGVLLSVLLTGEVSGSLALSLMAAYLLPVISYPLSLAGVIPEFDLWVWYLLGAGWLGMAMYFKLWVKHAFGTLTKGELSEYTMPMVFIVIWNIITGPVAYVVGLAQGYALSQTVGLYYLLSTPLAFPVAVLTDLDIFAHSSAIWVLIVVFWLGWFKGSRLVGN